MKFSEFKYERINMDHLKDQFGKLIEAFGNASAVSDQILCIKQFNDLIDKVDSMMQLVYIRHSLDTKDEFYSAEMEWANNNGPILREFTIGFEKAILQSKFRRDLEKEFGSLIFKKAELSLKTFKPEIIPDLQEENRLASEYDKLVASAEIKFNDKIYNLSQMRPFTSDKNRTTRKNSSLAVSNWFKEHESRFDELYDKLVKVRHEMAIKLGYKNFIQMAYDRFERLDYDAKDVKNYRDQVYNEIVPFVKELMERRKDRLKLDSLHSYDLSLSFLSGNAKPKGDRKWQVAQAADMYKQMSSETDEFFTFMQEKELMDLDSKSGKEAGGYCTYLPSFEAPFIFANFNGTSGDVDVLTHEAGHAFQVYSSRHLIPEYRWPTMEAAEIHSMSMEFLAWPYINKFFLEDTAKYKFAHLTGAIEFLPYGVLVDEFQHEVFNNPEFTPEERKALWRDLEKKYLPWKDYQEDPFLDKGTFWYRQGHIFAAPFYYIDYTLAQVIAFQFWGLAQTDYDKAWEKYNELCKLGGSKSFVGLIKAADLENPFSGGTIKKTMKPIKEYLGNINDSEF